MNKKIALIILVTIALIGALLFFTKYSKNTPQITETPSSVIKEPEDYSASFAIYTNGTFRIFTAPMYHNLSDEVFIEASKPNIVNVKMSDITWGDFFETLPFSLSENCLTTGTKQTFCTNEQYSLQFYLNGKRTQSALDQVINSGDKLLVTYDVEDSPAIQEQIQSIPNP